MAQLIGAMIGVYLISKLFGFVALRKFDGSKKANYSMLGGILIASILAAFGMADGGAPKFVDGFVVYGIAGGLNLMIQNIYFKFRAPKEEAEEATES